MVTTYDGTTSANNPAWTRVVVFLKWSKEILEFEIDIPTAVTRTTVDGVANGQDSSTFTGQTFKEVVRSFTKVPVDRQKIVVSKSNKNNINTLIKNATRRRIDWWEGILRNDFDFSSAVVPGYSDNADKTIELNVILMGTAEVLAPINDRPKFIEDMTAAEKAPEEKQALVEAMKDVEAMIPVIQLPPLERKMSINRCESDKTDADGEIEMPTVSDYEESRSYGKLVNGFSQIRIDKLLKHQKNPQNQSSNDYDANGLWSQAYPAPARLLGRVVMTLGLELHRAYVNDLAVLNEDGTLVSGLDNGHVHLWKHCQKLGDLVHESAGGIGIFDDFPGVDSVLALDDEKGPIKASFVTAGRGCIRVWNNKGEAMMGRSSPLPFSSPTGLVKVPIGYPKSKTVTSNFLCLAARFLVSPPPSRRPRSVPQDSEGQRRIAEIERSEALVFKDLWKLSKSIQILYVDIGSTGVGNGESNGNRNATWGNAATGNAIPTLRSLFLKSPNPVTALESWKDGTTQFLIVGDDHGGILFWKIELASSSSPEAEPPSPMRSSRSSEGLARRFLRSRSRSPHGSLRSQSSHGNKSFSRRKSTNIPSGSSHSNSNNPPLLKCTKVRYLRIASLEDPRETNSAIVCLKFISESKQLLVSTREIAPVSLSVSSSSDEALLQEVKTTVFPLHPAQAVHCINVDAILKKSHRDPLSFTLDGHIDVVHTMLPLPNGDLVTAGGKMDATTQVWSREQLQGAAASSAPPVLKEAAITNLCKDAGHIFAAESLRDFKAKALGDQQNDESPYAVAAARYNVVKIIL